MSEEADISTDRNGTKISTLGKRVTLFFLKKKGNLLKYLPFN
jgi:hypothetical protein